MPKLILTESAAEDLKILDNDPSQIKVLKAVLKALEFMKTNLRHPSLNTHEFKSLKGPNGEKVY